MTFHYAIGVVLTVSAIIFLSTQPVLALVLSACAVITLGRVLRKIL
jgi:hypothetical protein